MTAKSERVWFHLSAPMQVYPGAVSYTQVCVSYSMLVDTQTYTNVWAQISSLNNTKNKLNEPYAWLSLLEGLSDEQANQSYSLLSQKLGFRHAKVLFADLHLNEHRAISLHLPGRGIGERETSILSTLRDHVSDMPQSASRAGPYSREKGWHLGSWVPFPVCAICQYQQVLQWICLVELRDQVETHSVHRR